MEFPDKTELMVALDYPSGEGALKLVESLKSLSVVYKIGLELFIQEGPEFVRFLKQKGCRVFLDLKLYDIPNTVAKATRQICALGVDYFTFHLSGGEAMAQGILREVEAAQTASGRPGPMALGVSVLTSFDEGQWSLLSPQRGIEASVLGLAELAAKVGIPGLVCSAREVQMVRQRVPGLFTVVPGIRLESSLGTMPQEDQARILTPAEARALGAHAIVVGRPIQLAADPRKTVEEILEDLTGWPCN